MTCQVTSPDIGLGGLDMVYEVMTTYVIDDMPALAQRLKEIEAATLLRVQGEKLPELAEPAEFWPVGHEYDPA
jgi:hypothetical protein